jgi:hypothetical protein
MILVGLDWRIPYLSPFNHSHQPTPPPHRPTLDCCATFQPSPSVTTIRPLRCLIIRSGCCLTIYIFGFLPALLKTATCNHYLSCARLSVPKESVQHGCVSTYARCCVVFTWDCLVWLLIVCVWHEIIYKKSVGHLLVGYLSRLGDWAFIQIFLSIYFQHFKTQGRVFSNPENDVRGEAWNISSPNFIEVLFLCFYF